ncbi:pilus assembly protein PilZ [Youhaiella tibetensis]|uniref:PilZ domain-containing protein n=1 Tax=Paradevosia tibetensis TaxID=1447062 RepID=A0A5B9DL03_9HYPH|nr:PilZ domain-containing protein [Youhaiella tibetensis]AKR54480.1 pilus assembly protein PilZ [Devosia sp. H5989]QEE19605.1 PilZ domain-containing protein [Youhaiella tibetensis]GGF31587.1 pilus assembly protein PilZ [Youhaiella tibetensis]
MEERRRAQRHRTLKGGSIVFNEGRSAIDCTVRNLSEIGANLRVTSVVGIPDEFILQMSDKTTRDCRVSWRKATELGVAFVS